MPPHYRITTDCVTVSGDYRKHYLLIIILLIILLCNILKTKIKECLHNIIMQTFF